MIGTKLVLLLYLAFYFVRVEISHFALVVLTLLVYFCVNITIYIFNQTTVKRILLVGSISISGAACLVVHPLFCILVPLSTVELAAGFFEKKVIILLLAIIPIFYIQESFQPLYGLVAILCFMLYSVTENFRSMLVKDEAQIDSMRIAMQKITKHVNENSEYIRQSEYTFKLEERNRISQEIHDKIGHSLTGALFQMEAAKRLIETNPPKAAELLQNAIHISKDGIENIRFTLKNMKPPTEQVGIHRLKLMIDDFNAKQPLKAVLTYEGNLGIISPIQWKIIHENATEALTNAMKYSQATVVSIDIKVLNKLVRVEVKDNGAGTETIKKGLGLIGMEERTAAVDGKIIVDSTQGFSVTMLLPISI